MSNEENGDDKHVVTVFSYRSPVFSKEEINALLDLVEKYKTCIMNKSTSSAANHSKDIAWKKIETAFNNYGFKHERTSESLKTKWENMKKEARKITKNIIDTNTKYNDHFWNARLVAMLNECDNGNITTDTPQSPHPSDDDVNDISKNNITKNGKWEDIERHSEESVDDIASGKLVSKVSAECPKINRSMNFSPLETKILLNCVRQEKKYVFSKDITAKGIKIKNRAWLRISDAFNSQSTTKRTTKVLRTRFTNMKKLAKHGSFRDYIKEFSRKHEKLVNEPVKVIKTEPVFKDNEETDDMHDDGFNDLHNDLEHEDRTNTVPDPLCTVLNVDSGTSWESTDERDVAKVKIELLKYKMETAKLERQRILDAIQADNADRETRAIETALRLRKARLEALAVELRLPPSHPALVYTSQEAPAQKYIASL